MKDIIEVKPFHFPGSDTGCLLIHGFSGTPAEMLPLGVFLAGEGVTVSGMRLPGHGTKPSDLGGKTYRHWIESAVTELVALKGKCSRVFVIGLSMGGTIALHLAANYQVNGVVTICAPIYFDLKLYLTRPFKYLFSFKDVVGQNIKDPAARKKHIAYPYAPLSSIFQYIALLKSVRTELDRITHPMLVFHSKNDFIITTGNATHIYRASINSKMKELIWLENSGHIATIDYDKSVIMTETSRFIKQII